MATLTIELGTHEAQREFNLRQWDELHEDRELARLEGRIETDRHGHAVWSPVPNVTHADYKLKSVSCYVH